MVIPAFQEQRKTDTPWSRNRENEFHPAIGDNTQIILLVLRERNISVSFHIFMH